MDVTFHLNGQPAKAASGLTISELLHVQGIDPSHVVVEINRNIINREAFDSTVFSDDDTVEILRFVGGG